MHSAAMARPIYSREAEGASDGRRPRLDGCVLRWSVSMRHAKPIKHEITGKAITALPPPHTHRQGIPDVMRAATSGLPVCSQTSSVYRKQFVSVHARRPHWMFVRPAVGRPLRGSACQQPFSTQHEHERANQPVLSSPTAPDPAESHKCWELKSPTFVGNTGGGSLIIRLSSSQKFRRGESQLREVCAPQTLLEQKLLPSH